MQIIALQQYTDKYISLYQGQIRNLNKELAQRLIEQGIVREHDKIPDNSKNETITPIIGYEEGVATLAEGTGAPQD